MAIKQNFPDIKPSLNLDFANTKSLDPRIDFTRNSTATYYDGQTFAKAEENLFRYSQEFDNGAWVERVDGALSPDVAIAPDGTTTADVISFSSQFDNLKQFDLFLLPNTTYTISLFARRDSGTNQLTFFGALPNVQLGTFSPTSEWARYSATFTTTGDPPRDIMIIQDRNASGFTDVEIWGAQLEQRDQLTAYTPTTDQPITNYIPVLKTAELNEPRFDHDPDTGESKGLLIEEQRTNLADYSYLPDQNDGGVGWWQAANNNSTATRFGEETEIISDGGTECGWRAAAGAGPNTTYTLSVDCKQSASTSAQYAFLRMIFADGGPDGTVWFDITSGSKATIGLEIDDAGIIEIGNGWYRIYAVATAQASITNNYVDVRCGDTDGDLTSATAGEGMIFRRVQFEEGSFPTSYIKTEGSQVTRVADSASITGENFSEWYRQDEGTAYLEFIPVQDSDATSSIGVVFNDGTDNNWINMGQSGAFAPDDIGSLVKTNSSYEVLTLRHRNAITETGVPYKQAIAYKANDFASSYDGGDLKTGSSGTLPVVNQFKIFRGAFSSDTPNGYITKFAYYPKRLPNAVLQTLTEE